MKVTRLVLLVSNFHQLFNKSVVIGALPEPLFETKQDLSATPIYKLPLSDRVAGNLVSDLVLAIVPAPIRSLQATTDGERSHHTI